MLNLLFLLILITSGLVNAEKNVKPQALVTSIIQSSTLENVKGFIKTTGFRDSHLFPKGYKARRGDDRKVRSSSSPKWMEAVGKLNVDGVKTCTLTLVEEDEDKDSRIAITAYHCIDIVLGNKNKELNATFTSNSGKVIKATAKVLNHGGGDLHDWAILLLDKTISKEDVRPLLISGESVVSLREGVEDGDYENLVETAVGHSADATRSLGNKGKNLTYDNDCKINMDQNNYSSSRWAKDCDIYPGASGGAYVTSITFDDGETEHYISGIIEASSGKGLMTYVSLSSEASRYNSTPVIDILSNILEDYNEY
ncbi:hypothetical protein CXF85_16045 [Colwellia sp. 75C3]|nr:hypothetical protein CXF85_16045 [Colwellia sp. 75C3]